jgi:bifunctional DNase/RNase
MIEMELLDVRVEQPHNVPVVLLRESSGDQRVLPIFIGAPEATAIALAVQRYETQRPMTHDLFKNVLDELGVVLERVVVTDLQEKTFHAELHLLQGGRRHTVSSRPSDAIALAVRTGAGIFAVEAVLDAAAYKPEEDVEGDEDAEPVLDHVVEEFREFIERVNPEDFA